MSDAPADDLDQRCYVIKAKNDATIDAVSNAKTQDDLASRFQNAGALEPPYNPASLCALHEISSSLRPNVDAYAVNIEGFGHRLVPRIDLSHPDANDKLKDALYLDRLQNGIFKPPSGEEVETHKDQLQAAMRLEQLRLESFFENACMDMSFVYLRKLTRTDMEITGNAYWEVLRDSTGKIAQFVFVPSHTMRLMPVDVELTETTVMRRQSSISLIPMKMRKRFRRYVQVINGTNTVYFKELDDPRVVSSRTGRVYATIGDLQRTEHGAPAATEILHFRIYSSQSSYGVPRWIGATLSVLGSRTSEEVNIAYFNNKAVPPMALLVSGGRLSQGTVERIQDYIRDHLQGQKNFHSILVIEGEPMGAAIGANGGSNIKLEFKSLSDAQQKDAMFQLYEEKNAEKVGAQFRLPRIIRGNMSDFNRSCYSADTEVLTEHGWLMHDEVGATKIAVVNKDTGAVHFEIPKSLYSGWYEGDMVRLTGLATDVLVTPDHKMLVQTKGKNWDAPQASDLIGRSRLTVRVAAESFEGVAPKEFVLPRVDACQIVRGHSHDEPIAFDRFVEFLGYFCSDGGLLDTVHESSPYLVFVRQKKQPGMQRMQECLDAIGWKYSVTDKADGTRVFCMSNRCLRAWLKDRCGNRQTNRSLPAEIMAMLDTRHAQILFDALMLGDGSWDARERCASGSYYTSSLELAGQVQVLATLLGMRSRIRWSAGGFVWRVTLSKRTTSTICRSNGDGAEVVPYAGTVHCFSTSTGFYVTRRNGCIAYQGNTGDAALAYAEQQVFQPERSDMDYILDKRILTALGAKYHEFVSNAPDLRDPVQLSEAIARLCDVGVLTPAEARSFIGDIFNVEISRTDEAWTRIPMKLLLGGIAPPKTGDEGEDASDKPNIQLAPTDAAQVITVNEARSALGLPKLMIGEKESEDGFRTLAEFASLHNAKAPVQELAKMQDALEKVSQVARVKLLEEARKRMAVVQDVDEREGVA